MEPYYQVGNITLYHADSLKHPELWGGADVLVTDPPYGISYRSDKAKDRAKRHASIIADDSTAARDTALQYWGDKPAMVFGTWRKSKPANVRNTIVWCKGNSPGMGDVTSPFGSATEEIYILGRGFTGARKPNWVNIPTIGSANRLRPKHPTPKPIALMEWLISHCPKDWVIVDPFAGSGATLVAALRLGYTAVGVECDKGYCDVIVSQLERVEQGLPLI